MPSFIDYKDRFETVKLERSDAGVLEVTLHDGRGGAFPWGETEPVTSDKASVAAIPSTQTHRGGHGALGEAIATIARDSHNKVVIITAAGDIFSSKPPKSGVQSRVGAPLGGPHLWEDIQFYGSNLLLDLLDIPAPVIFCLNGPAYRHPEFPFTGDIVLAADDASIQDGTHFVLNVVPGDGVALVLPFLLGFGRARYFHLTGQILSAQDLKAIGLVHEIMPRERLLPRARELAELMLKNDPLVLRYTRFTMTAPLKALLRQHLPYTHALQALAALGVASGDP